MPQNNDVDAAFLRRSPLPMPERGDKDARGRIFVVAGGPQMPGAAILVATAALRAGAGKLAIGTTAGVAPHVGGAVPEALVVGLRETASGAISPANASDVAHRANASDALVVGPGMVDKSVSHCFVEAVVRKLEVPAVLDAIALGCLKARPEMLAHLGGRVILTPHGGEAASLLGRERTTIEADPAPYAAEAARRFKAVVVLKGQTTFIADPAGEVYRHLEGDIGLATSGSGDTLAGIIGGILSRGATPLAAACWGVFVHARAGAQLSRRIGMGFLAREIPAEVPHILRELRG